MLNVIRHGVATDRPALVIAHGLFGSARNWGAIARRLSEQRLVLAVDMRNHGDSPWFPSHGYPDLAADLAGVIRAEVGERADVLGHSMGGKAAMQLALTEGALVRRLVIADIAPVTYAHSQNHLIAAMRGLDLSGLALRSEADRRLAASVGDEGTRAFLLQSLDLRSDPPLWRLNLDTLEREMERITGWPGTQGRFDGATLFLTGALSTYVRSGDRELILAMFPGARFARIGGAGHWLHAERPREFVEVVRAFLDAP